MELLRLGGATLNQTALDFDGNAARITAVLRAARESGVDLLCLPELAICGYGCEDAFFSLNTARRSEAVLEQILAETKGLTVVIGLPFFYYGAMYNCAAMVQDGRILGLNAKRVLPREGVHYEPRWFRPWPFGKVTETRLAGSRVRFGDIRYRLGDIGVAVEICEEAWDSVPASAAHADAVDIIVNPSASHFALGKYARRETLVANSSRSMQVIYLYTNALGVESGRMIYDGGVLIAHDGNIMHRGSRFGFHDGRVTWMDVNPELASVAKLRVKPVRESHEPAAEAGIPGLPGPEVAGQDPRHLPGRGIRTAPVIGRSAEPVLPLAQSSPAAAGPVPRMPEEEFLFAQTLGLFDYMRKTRANGFVLSLSGGCDSSSLAVLIGHMAAMALQELGAPGLAARTGIAGLASAGNWRECMPMLLTCVYQSTQNSSQATQKAARAIAEAVGAEFHVIDIQSVVDKFTADAGQVLARPLTWQQDDIALQNIQARCRAPFVWLLANIRQAVLLTTSNRSESAVGYATMDGDTAGGLAPLAGIDKHFLRKWLVWAEQQCPFGLGLVPELHQVNVSPPTAELRPETHAQTDESDLMPYDVLDRIERLYVRDRLGPDDIFQALSYEFSSSGSRQLKDWINRFFVLFARNQWKRERIAPSFHLDDESLDPKTWCRYPILSSPPKVTDSKK